MYSAYLLINTKFGKKKLVSTRLNNFEEVSLLNETHGRYDLVIRIDCEDANSFEEFMQNNINTIEDIQKAETLIVANTSSGFEDDDLDEPEED
ncbi:Lrp/AsnC ligand binding domain-containing protein [Candidatus Woesearchaeota archaeon]|jgi:DNA-binding Lrp family transcriptional regulator|nr:Lrp/AsnC ligand binding domain-containing protein [Candidatus Woesearchaeota archaeon]MBT6520323.1 Lrp/AsnC ligand binding domain-containing protein [Candidatus Woesearchaeota archaeon]MBT7368276.1 Lrp/AsnC ligand binding domain-containing protein [Candidatus Woesearchaeota archaeon]